MITVKGRELIIPVDERQIGTSYDTDSEVRQFRISRFSSRGIDISHLNFHLDLEYADTELDTSLLEKVVNDDDIVLTWQIPYTCVQQPGTVWIAIRGYDDNGTIKWATNKGAVYVQDTVFNSEGYTGRLTELEQLERRIDDKTKILDENEQERQDAEQIRIDNENERIANETEWQRQAEEAITLSRETLVAANLAKEAAQGSANEAGSSADEAAKSESAAAQYAESAENSKNRAEEVAEGLGRFDGKASTVTADDNYNLGSTNVQGQLDSMAQGNEKINFEAATELANIVANEALNIMLSKIAAWFPALQGKVDATKVLTTLEEVSANTDATMVAGATAVEELNSSLTVLNTKILNSDIINLGPYEVTTVYFSGSGTTSQSKPYTFNDPGLYFVQVQWQGNGGTEIENLYDAQFQIRINSSGYVKTQGQSKGTMAIICTESIVKVNEGDTFDSIIWTSIEGAKFKVFYRIVPLRLL